MNLADGGFAESSHQLMAVDPTPETQLAKSQKEQQGVVSRSRLVRWRIPRELPRTLHEKFILAKMAFDELQRKFHAQSPFIYGKPAVDIYTELELKSIERRSFIDPELIWLEPEHDVQLLIDFESGRTFYWRVINHTPAILELDANRDAETRQLIGAIRDFSQSVEQLRALEAATQLSLFPQFEEETPAL